MFLFKRKPKIEIKGKENKYNSKKINLDINGNNNLINISDDIILQKIKKNKIKIIGDNNIINISEGFVSKNSLYINIVGSNNEVELDKNIIVIDELCIQILENCENGKITVGANTTFWNTMLQTTDINSAISIGDDCMFSYNTVVMNSDGHSIFQNGELINRGKNLFIGNHCWIGYDAVISKNVKLPNNAIVGRRALVTQTHESDDSSGIVYGGVPARIIKTGMSWSRDTINQTLNSKAQTLVNVEKE